MSEQDPPRLLESSSPYVRSLLQAGESEVPDQAKLASLALKLGPILGGAGGAGGAGGGGGAITGKAAAAAKTASVGFALKVTGGALLAAALTVSSAIYVPKMIGAPARSTSTGIAISESTATPLATTLAPPVETIAPAASSSVVAAARKPAVVIESPDAEVRLLERAQDALRTRPDEALALCTEHASRFPQGLLTQEREVIAIEALTQTGKMPEANARASRFAANYPSSTHLRRVEALVGRKF